MVLQEDRAAALAEEQRLAAYHAAERHRRARTLAEQMAREKEDKEEEERLKRICALDAKMDSLRQSVIQQESFDLDPAVRGFREEGTERMERMKAEAHAIEQDIEGATAGMKAPGWLQQAHEALRKEALKALMTLAEGSEERLAALSAQETSEQKGGSAWTGTDQEMLEAQQTIDQLSEKTRRLRERCTAPFIAEKTLTAIREEIAKTEETKSKLEGNVTKTLHERAEQRRRVLPARPASTWINLQLLRQQHASLLRNVQPHVHCIQRQAQEEEERRRVRDSRTRELLSKQEALEHLSCQENEIHESNMLVLQQQRSKLAQILGRLASLSAEPGEMAETYLAQVCELDDSLIPGEVERWRNVAERLANERDRLKVELEHVQRQNNPSTRKPAAVVASDIANARGEPTLLNQRVRLVGLEPTDDVRHTHSKTLEPNKLNGLMATAREYLPDIDAYKLNLDVLPEAVFTVATSKLEGRGLPCQPPCAASSWAAIKGRLATDDSNHPPLPLVHRRLATAPGMCAHMYISVRPHCCRGW